MPKVTQLPVLAEGGTSVPRNIYGYWASTESLLIEPFYLSLCTGLEDIKI